MSTHSVTIELAPGRAIVVETGKMALLAGGSVTVQQGETIVLVAACSDKPRPGIDFFPLQVDYREKFSAAGRFPGGYFKREGRPSEKEILTARMTDRPLRPLFPKGFRDDVQIMSGLLSADGVNEADVLSMLGASFALMISDIPFNGPIAALRVGRVDGEFVANPTHPEMERSELDLVYAGAPGKTMMIEGSADEVSEEILRDAFVFADTIVQRMVEAQKELAAHCAKEKKSFVSYSPTDEMVAKARDFCRGKLEDACLIPQKQKRYAALDGVFEELVEALAADTEEDPEENRKLWRKAFDEVTEETVRRLILEQGKRSDGRGNDDLRPISIEAGLLPRAHGSALFSRGETQALVSTTLGTERDVQEHDAITGGAGEKSFLLHYNFPNFSVGETGRIAGPGRREIGHGALAERCVAGMLPEEYPYTIRCVSDILGSNGSSSMASVCGASMSLMDAGVPLKKAVAGISVGLVSDPESGRKIYLTDILGSEDHYGDMDFKVAGTRDGITGFQLDLKIDGLDFESMFEAMKKNREARMQILDRMDQCLSEPRPELSTHAPRIETVQINPEKIGALIGPGGSNIRAITEKTDTQINVDDDGVVSIYANNREALDAAIREVETVAAEPEIGRIYKGTVKTVRDFGAFVEILPGQDGLLHISEMADYHVKNVEEICKVGDSVTVKVIDIDDRGRVRLSRKAALAELE